MCVGKYLSLEIQEHQTNKQTNKQTKTGQSDRQTDKKWSARQNHPPAFFGRWASFRAALLHLCLPFSAKAVPNDLLSLPSLALGSA
jgi:hypothetical protein